LSEERGTFHGAGKSTLWTSLLNKYPNQIGLIQLDDYFKKKELIPDIMDLITGTIQRHFI